MNISKKILTIAILALSAQANAFTFQDALTEVQKNKTESLSSKITKADCNSDIQGLFDQVITSKDSVILGGASDLGDLADHDTVMDALRLLYSKCKK